MNRKTDIIQMKIIVILAAFILFFTNIASGKQSKFDESNIGIAVTDTIELAGAAAFIDSYRSTINVYSPLKAEQQAIVTVNSKTINSVTLLDNATINGDLYVGPEANVNRAVRKWGSDAITGKTNTLDDKVLLPMITTPDIAPFNEESTGNFSTVYNEKVSIDTDMHVDSFETSEGSIVTIDGTVVIVVDGDFKVNPDAQLIVTTGSTLDLYVKGNCDISGIVNAELADPQGLYLFMTGEDASFDIYDTAAIFCILQNPDGSVNIKDQAQFFGRIKAKSLISSGGIHIDMDSVFPDVSGTGGNITIESMKDKQLLAGSFFDIKWKTEGPVDNVIIEYSTDQAETWTTIDTVTNTDKYEWFVPDEMSQQCYFRVLDASMPEYGDVSEPFTIYICQLLYDLNGDCKVNAEDAKIMAKEWMTCGNPFDPECNK